MNKIDNFKKTKIMISFLMGNSIRKIAHIEKVSKVTVFRLLRQFNGKLIPGMNCDNCKVRLVNPKSEYFRKTKRTKHKFCSHFCYGEFTRKKNENDKCKRCGMLRKEKLCEMFTRGFCSYCYGLLRSFNFDNNLANIHELRLKLKEKLNENKEHVRT